MDDELKALEHMLLDQSAEPMMLSFSTLQGITNRFSEDRQIGRGGFSVVYKHVEAAGDGRCEEADPLHTREEIQQGT